MDQWGSIRQSHGVWQRQLSPGPRDGEHLAIDGKTALGSRGGDTPGIHLVAAYAPEVKAVVGPLRVDAKTNEYKAALELLGILPVQGKVVSGDAMFTHRDVCSAVVEGGGDYFLPVKDNQRRCVRTSRPFSPSPMRGFPPLQTKRAEAEIGHARESDKGHGWIEQRTIETTSALAGYLDPLWPGCAQVFRLRRERRLKGKTETEVVLGITSLSRERASPAQLLSYTREHWGIENGLHGVRDGTLAEDACRIRKGAAPQVMAILRNVVVFLFGRRGYTNARYFVCNPLEACALLSTPN